MRLIKFAFILFILLLPISANAATQSVTSIELIEEASALDEKTVSYSGEVIGDILHRGDYAWINVSDGANSIGCYIPASEADKIEYIGRYRIIGDTVQLTGTFHRDCAEHGGDMDIHAAKIAILEKGHTVEDNPSAGLLIAASAVSLCALAGAILIMKKKSML